MTDRSVIAVLTLAVVSVSVWACFKGIAWVVRNGWRSMLGLVALRGEAVVSFDDHAGEALAILRTHEAVPDVDQIGSAAMWQAYEADLTAERDIAKHLRRMERWSR